MTIEITVLVAVISCAVGAYVGVSGVKRNQKADIEKDVATNTTMMIELRNISKGIEEIKSEVSSVKSDIKEERELRIRLDEVVKNLVETVKTLQERVKQLEDKRHEG
jgi:predicted nuclease with TOPRIM domain